MEEWKIADNGFAYRCGNNFREKIYITEKYDICYTSAIIADDDSIVKFDTKTLKSGIAGRFNAELAVQQFASDFNDLLKLKKKNER